MTVDDIAQLGEKHARRYNSGSIAPFPYENILAAHSDLEIYFADLEDKAVSGVILFKDGKFNILINNTKPETRQHFSLAHELGHYFLHKDILNQGESFIDGDAWLDGPTIMYRMDGVPKTQYELEANTYAASLIMPAELVRRAWEVTKSVQECAKIFKVSVIAMSVRLTKLGLVK